MLKLPYTSSLYIFGLLHQNCCTAAPTYVPPYIKPVMPRLLHHHSIPTSSLLCSGSYIPAMARSQHAPTDIMPVMPRSLHHYPSPTSSLIRSGLHIKPIMLRRQGAYHPTASLRCSSSYTVPVISEPNTYPRDFQGRFISYTSLALTWPDQVPPICFPVQAGYAPAPTIPSPTHTTNIPKFHPGLGLGT